ncbi:MAG: hypothetical protein OEU54_01255 [Gemmatimonadota bacterium]|nr:hypothetical protein [Gemmatimonadota bacterium]
MKRPLVFLALIVAAPGLGCGSDLGRVSGDAHPSVRSAVETCSTEGAAARQDCYEERLLAELEASGVRPALDMLAGIAAADVDVQREAHVYTHAIGIAHFDPDRPVAEVFAECTELFQSGCYHGVIQAHFMARGAPDEESVTTLCEPFKSSGEERFELFQCLHGLGHGLTMFYGHHLPRALEDCDFLPDNWDRESCYGGVFMENVVAAISPHHVATELASETRAAADAGDEHEHAMAMAMTAEDLEPFEPLRADDPHYPCSILDVRYLTACYLMQTSAMLHHNGQDFGHAAESCAGAPESWRKTCFQSLGRDISAYTLQDHEDGLRACRQSPPEFRDFCYVGLVKNYVDLTATTEDAFRFCTSIEEEYKARCNQALGEQIGTLQATEAGRRQECARAESDVLERSCLYGARVPVS